MITRRQFLKAGVVAGVGVLLPWEPNVGRALARPTGLADPPKLDPAALTKYVDPLPIPSVLRPKGRLGNAAYYEVAMTQFGQKLHRDLPPTTLWGYNGTYPGPTIEAFTLKPIVVKWINNLPNPKEHLLPVDFTIHGAEDRDKVARTVVHLHGGHVPPESDGYPESTFLPDHSDTYHYPNLQPSTTLWYHDHALGITRLNVYAGLAAFYLLRGPLEKLLRLPMGKYEIPIVIQDRSFHTDGSLFYPKEGDTHPVWVPEFFGDVAVVNGKIWPFLNVEPRRYRFRLLNGSNSRFYRLKLSSGQPFCQIGTDGGFLLRPAEVTNILLAPAERADVIVDFSGQKGRQILMTNDAPAPFPGGGETVISEIMQFRVEERSSERDTSALPLDLFNRFGVEINDAFDPLTHLAEHLAIKTRNLTLEERLDSEGNPIILLLNGAMWDDPVTENPRLGTVEIWQLINLTMDTHPIHLHLVQFRILDRRPFDVGWYKEHKEIRYTGPARPPDPNEAGLKDTVRANPGEVIRIIVPFTDFTGRYVWHCHILEHEDNEMMRPYDVVPR